MKDIKHFKRRIFMSPNVLTVMAYKQCPVLDLILNIYLDSGIKDIRKCDPYYIYIIFNNGILAKLWDENRYYGWLSRGVISDFYWERIRPKKSTMRRLRYMIKNFYLNKYDRERV